MINVVEPTRDFFVGKDYEISPYFKSLLKQNVPFFLNDSKAVVLFLRNDLQFEMSHNRSKSLTSDTLYLAGGWWSLQLCQIYFILPLQHVSSKFMLL